MSEITIRDGLKKLNIDVKFDYDTLVKYRQILVEWNEKINLTNIIEPDDVDLKHYLDSMTLFLVPEFLEISTLVDVGTGAGFPSLPLKIANDKLNVTLLDPLLKRIKFLDNVVEELDLKNVETLHIRAEEAGQKLEYREKYDLATSRAVANLSALSEYCIPLVKVGGKFVAMKGKDCDQEIEEARGAIKLLGGEISDIINLSLSEGENERTLIVIKKVKPTPKKYPRRTQQIKTKTL